MPKRCRRKESRDFFSAADAGILLRGRGFMSVPGPRRSARACPASWRPGRKPALPAFVRVLPSADLGGKATGKAAFPGAGARLEGRASDRRSPGKEGRGTLAKSGSFIYTPLFQRAIMQPWGRRAVRSGNHGGGFGTSGSRTGRLSEGLAGPSSAGGVRRLRHIRSTR